MNRDAMRARTVARAADDRKQAYAELVKSLKTAEHIPHRQAQQLASKLLAEWAPKTTPVKNKKPKWKKDPSVLPSGQPKRSSAKPLAIRGRDLTDEERQILRDKPPSTADQDVRWVYQNLPEIDPCVKSCPSRGAWGWLMHIQQNSVAESDFYTKIYPKLMPTRSEIDHKSKVVVSMAADIGRATALKNRLIEVGREQLS